MNIRTRLMTASLLLLPIIGFSAQTTAVIQKETPHYSIDIKYPQGFKIGNVDAFIKKTIVQTKEHFIKELPKATDESTHLDLPGKTSLTVGYSVPFQSATALSVRFDISTFYQGAAHPINTVIVTNFINGKEVKLSDLFSDKENYLKVIAQFAKEKITARKISEAATIEEGTKPIAANYAVWAFSPKGLTLLFNNYQVAAYVYGVQKVSLPLSLFSSLLKPEVAKSVWGN